MFFVRLEKFQPLDFVFEEKYAPRDFRGAKSLSPVAVLTGPVSDKFFSQIFFIIHGFYPPILPKDFTLELYPQIFYRTHRFYPRILSKVFSGHSDFTHGFYQLILHMDFTHRLYLQIISRTHRFLSTDFTNRLF